MTPDYTIFLHYIFPNLVIKIEKFRRFAQMARIKSHRLLLDPSHALNCSMKDQTSKTSSSGGKGRANTP